MAAGTIKKITMQDYILSRIPPNRCYDLKSRPHWEGYLNSLAFKKSKVLSKDLKITNTNFSPSALV